VINTTKPSSNRSTRAAARYESRTMNSNEDGAVDFETQSEKEGYQLEQIKAKRGFLEMTLDPHQQKRIKNIQVIEREKSKKQIPRETNMS